MMISGGGGGGGGAIYVPLKNIHTAPKSTEIDLLKYNQPPDRPCLRESLDATPRDCLWTITSGNGCIMEWKFSMFCMFKQ